MTILQRAGTGIAVTWGILGGLCFVVAFSGLVSGTLKTEAANDFFNQHPLFCCAVVVTLAGAVAGICMGEE